MRRDGEEYCLGVGGLMQGVGSSWFGMLLGKKNRPDQDSFGRSQGEDEGYKFRGDGGVEVYGIAWLCYSDGLE